MGPGDDGPRGRWAEGTMGRGYDQLDVFQIHLIYLVQPVILSETKFNPPTPSNASCSSGGFI